MSDGNDPGALAASLAELRQASEQAVQLQHGLLWALTALKDLVLQAQTTALQAAHRNPLNAFGRKCFSQTDEDGITLEIVRRLGLAEGVYAEFGVGDGLENNTLILAALGWKGFWVGGEELAVRVLESPRFAYIRDWITRDNILAHAATGLSAVAAQDIDVLSLDLDGNDIHFAEALLQSGLHPKLFIVEYNAKFPPPVRFEIPYNPEHRWVGDDFFGASLTSFADLFARHGYTLVCCNAHTGSNAFFVRSDHAEHFADVPEAIADIYVSPRYHLYAQHGHRPSPQVVETILYRAAP